MYRCYECGKEKEHSEYTKREIFKAQAGLPTCKSCLYKSIRNYIRFSSYGVTEEQYEDMLIDQLGVCAICRKRDKSGKALAIDHCHDTGKVRGLLCSNCNTGIGMLKEDESIFVSAIEYLRKHK